MIQSSVFIKYDNYIIDCTTSLNITPAVMELFNDVAAHLKKIRSFDKSISEIGIAGGFVLDTMLGLDPSDIDLKYAMRDNDGNFITTCKCDYVRTLVDKVCLGKDFRVDIGNIKENNNDIFDSIVDKQVSILSHHPEYISQFSLDEDGRIWGNIDSLNDFNNKIYNPRTEGLMAWISHEGKTYYEALAILLIRGFGYIKKRDLRMGEKFKYYMSITPKIFEIYSKERHDHAGLVTYFNKKVGSLANLEALLDIHNISYKNEVVEPIKNWLCTYS